MIVPMEALLTIKETKSCQQIQIRVQELLKTDKRREAKQFYHCARAEDPLKGYFSETKTLTTL